jgi:dihydroorotate dehydrogenase electron transfer subunit
VRNGVTGNSGNRQIARVWSTLRSRDRVAVDTYWLEFDAPEIADRARPGQFAMIGFGLGGYATPFLPRPNSIAAVRNETIGFLIRVFGEGSRRLAAMTPGDRALLLGPLGTAYELRDARRVVCVAGGVGLAPFIFLPRWAAAHVPDAEVRLLYGERSGAAVFDLDRLRELSGIEPDVWTEDGELGRRGPVTTGLETERVDLILTCGPTAMLRAVRALALEAGVPCQVAVEEHMACGVGTCIGCVVETADPESPQGFGYTRACVHGPVFPAERLRW